MNFFDIEFRLQGHLGPFRPLSVWAQRVRHLLGGAPPPPRRAGGTNPNPWRLLEVQTRASMAAKLCDVVRQGDPARLRRALQSSVADPNRPDANGDCAQTAAILSDNLEMLTIVLDDARVDPNRRWERFRSKSPLIGALEHGSDEMVNALLDRSDVDRERTDASHRKPYEVAAEFGRLAALRRLLQPFQTGTAQGQAMLETAGWRAAANQHAQTLLYVWDQADDNTRRSIVHQMVFCRNMAMLQVVADHEQGLDDQGSLPRYFGHAVEKHEWDAVLTLCPLMPPQAAISTDVLKALFAGPPFHSSNAARYALVARHGCSYLDAIERNDRSEEAWHAAQRKVLGELRRLDADTLALALTSLLPAAAQAYDLELTEDSPFVQELLQDVPDAPAIAAKALALMRELEDQANLGYRILQPDQQDLERFVCVVPLVNALLHIAGQGTP